MKKDTTVVSSSGIGFCSLLTIVFIVLKLCKIIAWSWFWVLSPLIFSVGLSIILIIATILVALIID